MPLVKCPDCGRSVSSNAVSCPSCGNPIGGGGSSGASAFEKRIEQYKAAKYQVLKRNGDTVELVHARKQGVPTSQKIIINSLLIISTVIFFVSLIMFLDKSALIGFMMVAVSCLLFIPAIKLEMGSRKVILTLTKAGKISEEGNVLKKK